MAFMVVLIAAALTASWLLHSVDHGMLFFTFAVSVRLLLFPTRKDLRRMAVILGSDALSNQGLDQSTYDIRGFYYDACDDVSEGAGIGLSAVRRKHRPIAYMLRGTPFNCTMAEAISLTNGYVKGRTPLIQRIIFH